MTKNVVNSILYPVLPIFRDTIVSNKSKAEIINALTRHISPTHSDLHSFTGKVHAQFVEFKKRDISPTIQSELVFRANIFQAAQNTIVNVRGKYKMLPMLAYFAFITIFTVPLWPIDHPAKLILPALPYMVMVGNIKLRSRKILSDLREIVK